MKEPLVTVYIPSRNYAHFLSEAVESVLRQTFEDWELLIIDDNSTDDTAQIMQRYRGPEKIRLMNASGIGLPAVCNLALSSARGKYIIRLDGDDIFDENILLVLSHFLESHPDHAMVFPDYFLMDEYGEVFSYERHLRLKEKNHMLDAPANGACSLVRVEALRELGGYREDLGAQDGYDLWNKLKKTHRIANINLPLFYYRRHGKNLTNRANHILFAKREIDREHAALRMHEFRPISAIIPARTHYDFVTDAWNLSINNKTLLARAIERCLASKVFDQVIVACDNDLARETTERYDDPRLHFTLRNPRDTLRSVPLARSLESIVHEFNVRFEGISVVTYVLAPFVTTRTVEDAVYTMVLNDADCSFGVEEIKDPLYVRTANGLSPLNPPRGISTDFDAVYRDMAISIATKNINLLKGSMTGNTCIKFVTPASERFYVDSEQDLRVARVLAEDYDAA